MSYILLLNYKVYLSTSSVLQIQQDHKAMYFFEVTQVSEASE